MERDKRGSNASEESGYRDARVLQMLAMAQDDMTSTVEKLQSHLFVLQDQISLLETKQKKIFKDVFALHQETMKMEMEPKAEAIQVRPSEVRISKISNSSKKKSQIRGRSAAITKESDLKRIRERLRDYNERTSRILGGRLSVTLDNGVSLMCLVNNPLFDAVAAFLILFNSFVVGWETEWATSNTQMNPTIKALSSFCNWIFLLELVLRIAAFKGDFFCNPERRAWNFFDFSLVFVGLIDEFSEADSGTVGSVKMLKMIRILRIFRVFRFFRPLARLALMIMDSIRSLLWAMFMLALITYVFGISLTSEASTWLMEQVDTSQADWPRLIETHPDNTVRLVDRYYGSLIGTLYTLAQTVLAGVNWHEVMEPLLEVGWFPATLQLLYIAFTLLAVLNVITGVFVDNAFRSADKQQQDIIQKEVDKKEESLALIRGFFDAVDVRQEGLIELEDLVWFLDDATMDAFFRVLGFHCHDKQRFMQLFDLDGTGTVSFEEFFEGCMKYRGVAQGVDLHLVIREVSRLQKTVNNVEKHMRCLTGGNMESALTDSPDADPADMLDHDDRVAL